MGIFGNLFASSNNDELRRGSSRDEALARTSGYRAALDKQFSARLPRIKEGILGSFADRGLGLGGLATEGVQRGVADAAAANEAEAERSILGAQTSIEEERRRRAEERSANPFGTFFG